MVLLLSWPKSLLNLCVLHFDNQHTLYTNLSEDGSLEPIHLKSFILLSVLRQVHRLFQSEFSTECDLALALWISSIISFLTSSSSYLRLLPRHTVSSILSSIVPSITCFSRRFQSKMWPIQLAFRLFITCRILMLNQLKYLFTASTICWCCVQNIVFCI